MPISFACDCGRILEVQQAASGRSVGCPYCGSVVRVPERAFVPRPTVASPRPVEPLRPYRLWRDPIVLIGGSVPTLILVVFFGYLWKAKADRDFSARITATKAAADRLYTAGRLAEANEAYLAVLNDGAGWSGDPQTKIDIRAAATMVGRLKVELAEMKKARDAADHLAAIEQAAFAAELRDRERLGRIRATVAGRAWVESTQGNVRPARGLEIRVLPARTPRAGMGDLLTSMRADAVRGAQAMSAAAQNANKVIDRENAGKRHELIQLAIDKIDLYLRADDDSEVETQLIYLMCRVGKSSGMFDLIAAEPNWARFVKARSIDRFETDINGQFSFDGLRAGRYCLVASFISENFALDWVIPLEIEKAGEMTQNLHNSNASFLVNKSDSGAIR